MNVQYAIKNDVVYVLEVNPRASRTTPFVSKATGVPLAKVAARIMAGRSLAEQGLLEDLTVDRIFVKESVFPFLKFPGADILLGPEMKSTGEVMGISTDFGLAFAKSQQAAGYHIPTSGTVFISVNDFDKPGVLPHAKALDEMGLHIVATRGTAEYLNAHGVKAEMVYKVQEGRPNIVDQIKDGKIRIVFNTPLGRESFYDDSAIRKSATLHNVLVVTTLTATAATVQAIRALRENTTDVLSLQEIHALARGASVAPAAPVSHSLLVKPLYLALSGGGAHAAAHAGVLRGLERAGVPVAGVAGVSGGALVAAAWAGGADLDQLVDQASRLHPWMWVRGWGGGLLSGSRLGALIDEFVPVPSFEGLRVPRGGAGDRRRLRRGRRVPRGQRARRGAGLVQLPRVSSRPSCGTAGGSWTGA